MQHFSLLVCFAVAAAYVIAGLDIRFKAAAVEIIKSFQSCNFSQDSKLHAYISPRIRYFFNSTKDEEDNAITIAAAAGDEVRAEAIAIVLQQIFRYASVRIVPISQCHFAFACTIRISDLHIVSYDYADLGFICNKDQIYFYSDKKNTVCALQWENAELGKISGNSLLQKEGCNISNNVRLFDRNCTGGYLHFSKNGCQQKKLVLAKLAAFDAELEQFLLHFSVSSTLSKKHLCSWISNAITDTRNGWSMTRMSEQRTQLTIGLMWPNGEKLNDSSILLQANSAIHEVNNLIGCDSIANKDARCMIKQMGFELKLINKGMDCDKANMLHFYSKVTCDSSPQQPLVGIIAGTCSETIRPIVELSTEMKIIVVSPTVESVIFNDVNTYPFFFRTIPSLAAYSEIVINYLRDRKWPSVGLLSNGKLFLRREEFEKHNNGLKICHEEVIEEELLTLNAALESLRRAKKSKCQIFAMDYFRKGSCIYLCAAHKLQMYQVNNYLFILANRAKNIFANGTVNCANTTALIDDNPNGCTHKGIRMASDGHLIIRNHLESELKTTNDNDDEDKLMNDYFGVYTRNAIFVIANAVAKLIVSHPNAVYHLSSSQSATVYKSLIENTTFDSGDIFQSNNKSKNSTQGSKSSSSSEIFHFDKNHDIGEGHMMIVMRRADPLLNKKVNKFFSGTIDINETRAEISNVALEKLRRSKVKSTEAAVYKWIRVYDKNGNSQLNITRFIDAKSVVFATKTGEFIVAFVDEDNCRTGFMRFIKSDLTCAQTIVLLIVLIFLILIVILIAIFFITLRYFRQHEEQRLTAPFQQLRNDLCYKELPRSRVVVNRKMGEGYFGAVFGGEVQLSESDKSWTSCAIKILHDNTKQDTVIQFLEEAVALTRVDHENIIKLLAVCTSEEPFCMVMEMCLMGDLKSFLMARRTQALNSNQCKETCPLQLTKYATHIAKGIEHLHSRNMVHRDLALRNCMVNEKYEVKIGDFGLARETKQDYYRVHNHKLVPVRWMPPESIQYLYFTFKSDIWSYAVLLYELVTFGKFPFHNLSHQQVMLQVPRGLTLIPNFPLDATETLKDLVTQCWQFEPADRPDINSILNILTNNKTCVTACLDDAPPHQPPEEVDRKLLDHHQRSVRQHSGDKDQQQAVLSNSSRQLNSLSVNSTSSLGKVDRSRIMAVVTNASSASKSEAESIKLTSNFKKQSHDPHSSDSAPTELHSSWNGDSHSCDYDDAAMSAVV